MGRIMMTSLVLNDIELGLHCISKSPRLLQTQVYQSQLQILKASNPDRLHGISKKKVVAYTEGSDIAKVSY